MHICFMDETGSIAIAAKTGRYMNIVGLVAPIHAPVVKQIMRRARRQFPELGRGEYSSSNVREPVTRFVLEQVAASPECQIAAVVIDKQETQNYQGDRENLYNAAVVQLMERIWEQHQECRVIIHRRHDKRELRDRLTQQIQQRARDLGIHLPRDWVDHRRARGESGLEVADAVAYAFHRRQQDHEELYEIIYPRILSEEKFRGA